MNIWDIYDYLVNTVHPYMVSTGQCLYNALVLTMAGPKRSELPNVPEMSRERLIQIRDTALELAKMVEHELQARLEQDGEECGDCGARGDHHCPAWCDTINCEKCYPNTFGARA